MTVAIMLQQGLFICVLQNWHHLLSSILSSSTHEREDLPNYKLFIFSLFYHNTICYIYFILFFIILFF